MGASARVRCVRVCEQAGRTWQLLCKQDAVGGYRQVAQAGQRAQTRSYFLQVRPHSRLAACGAGGSY